VKLRQFVCCYAEHTSEICGANVEIFSSRSYRELHGISYRFPGICKSRIPATAKDRWISGLSETAIENFFFLKLTCRQSKDCDVRQERGRARSLFAQIKRSRNELLSYMLLSGLRRDTDASRINAL
jgi:hypothetical protein